MAVNTAIFSVATGLSRIAGLAREVVAAGEDETAEAEHRRLVQLIDKAVKRGALHRNTGARKKSRAAKLRRGESA